MEDVASPQRCKLVVGLGNPGDRYRRNRHNLGFRVLDHLIEGSGFAKRRVECNALVAARADELVLAWPQTFMNRSGYAVRCLLERRDLDPGDVLVIYDDTALPLGVLRLRGKGGPGGHRGMESIINNLRTESVARLRLGVAPARAFTSDEDLSDFVLSDFEDDEIGDVDEMIERAVAACTCWLDEGIEPAMNRFNG